MNLPSCAGEGRAGCGEGASGRGRGARGSVARLVLLLLLVGLDVLPPEPRVAAVAINVRHHVQPGQKEPLRAGPRSSGQSGRSVAVAAGRVRVKHRRGRAERGRERPRPGAARRAANGRWRSFAHLLRRTVVHIDHISKEPGVAVPAAELAGDHLVVSCQVRRTQGAAVYALRLDVTQKEAAHSAQRCQPAGPALPGPQCVAVRCSACGLFQLFTARDGLIVLYERGIPGTLSCG